MALKPLQCYFVAKNFEWKFAVFALNLMIWFQERVEVLAALFFELLNIPVLEHKVYLKKLLFIVL